MLFPGLFHHVMGLDLCVLIENITVNCRFLCIILKEGAGDVSVRPTEMSHLLHLLVL